MTIYAKVTDKTINIGEAVDMVRTADHGAIDVFIGTVRNNHNGKEVTGITYDAHEKLSENIFYEICEEAIGLWPDTRHAVIHYKGDLPVGGTSIIIAVSSRHRAESFEACRYILEEIKTQAPIWKQEHYVDGKSDWLPGHSLRHDAEHGSTCCGKCCREQHG